MCEGAAAALALIDWFGEHRPLEDPAWVLALVTRRLREGTTATRIGNECAAHRRDQHPCHLQLGHDGPHHSGRGAWTEADIYLNCSGGCGLREGPFIAATAFTCSDCLRGLVTPHEPIGA